MRVTGTLLTQTPSASPPKKKAVQDNTKANKAKARFDTITPLFFSSDDYHPKRKKKKSITRCNNPFRPLYIFTYFIVRLHSAMLMQENLFGFFFSVGIRRTVGVEPALISAVTFQMEMLMREYYHRECFPQENYPEH